ncbi:hypothetical protein AVEN_57264-1 [Araneus ventricosus]|uniref:Uncharacterized protein n=1 Tax=Araneus ventricosus TaxID=182803 RepID=A0A4Y2QNA1_ARAVE|nr:hypothetical protein AVEN_57264-1 [Araneus ventricosus]
MTLQFSRRGGRFARQGTQPAVRRDECNEIRLKFLTDYYLSTTVEIPSIKIFPDGIKKFSSMGVTASPTGALDPRSPSGATPANDLDLKRDVEGSGNSRAPSFTVESPQENRLTAADSHHARKCGIREVGKKCPVKVTFSPGKCSAI